MGFEDDPYRDVDGEPLVDFDEGFGNDREPSTEPIQDFDENLADDIEDWEGEGSRTPVYDNDKVAKPRKRLVKKASSGRETIDVPELIDEDVEDGEFDEFMEGRGGGRDYDDKVGKKRKKEKDRSSSGSGKEKRHKLPGRAERKSDEINEMWDSIARNPENDEEGVRTMDDDNFIDDAGLDPSERYGGHAGDRSPTHYPQAEEGEDDDDEVNKLFKMGKKKKKTERNPAEIAILVENVMADLEVTAEEDAELNRQGKPAINKLKKLSLLTDVLGKKQLQTEFLDHGVLTLLKNWLEPLPDGSLPNINIRAAILRVLTDFPIDLDQYDRREQLKKSGLGKVIMFLSKSDEETTSNRRLAKDLVDKWSRPIFNKSTRFEDMRNVDEDRVPYRRPPVKKPIVKAPTMETRDGDFDLDIRARKSGLTSGQSSRGERQMTMRPEATPLDFVIRPQSKIDPDEVMARSKQQGSQDLRRMKMNKKLQQLKGTKKKRLQATKVSVEGRGMIKYL